MGLNTGEPLYRRDSVTNNLDFYGPVVNEAARITSLAIGGEILLRKEIYKRIKAHLDYLSFPVIRNVSKAKENARAIIYQVRLLPFKFKLKV
jgi:class 3 adenylate cyclase